MMQQTDKASPRPWYIAGDSGNEGEAEIIESETRGIGWTQDTWDHAQDEAVITAEDRANGALIVKAVNAHDELVEALHNLLDQLEGVGIYIKGQDEGQWFGTEGLSFAEASTALAKAEGE